VEEAHENRGHPVHLVLGFLLLGEYLDVRKSRGHVVPSVRYKVAQAAGRRM